MAGQECYVPRSWENVLRKFVCSGAVHLHANLFQAGGDGTGAWRKASVARGILWNAGVHADCYRFGTVGGMASWTVHCKRQ